MMAHRLTSLSPAFQRYVAVTLVPVLAGLIWLAIYVPIVAVRDSHMSWRVQARDLLARTADAKAIQSQLDQDLASLQASPTWTRFYQTDRQGASALSVQSDVAGLMNAVSANAQSLTPIPSVPMPHFTRVGLQVSASMRIDQLKGFVEALIRHQKYLRIEHLTVSAPQVQVPDENPALAVTMVVHGFEISRSGDAGAAAATLAMQESQR